MSMSCEKDDPVPDPVEITEGDLVGDWTFQSLEFNGELYTDCNVELNLNYNGTTMSILDVTTTTMTLYNDCMDGGASPSQSTYNYTLVDNEINCEDIVKFKIKEVELFDGTKLVLEMTYATYGALPVGGVFTLTK